MDYATGKVKKYSREYNRTLKDGTKKKYKTEQVQITIPKQENIFEDDEEVIILHNNSLDNIESDDEILAALEFQNYLLTQEIIKNNEKLLDKDLIVENLEEDVSNLNKIITDKNNEIDELNQDILDFKDIISSKDIEIDNLKKDLIECNNIIKSKDDEISSLNDDTVDNINDFNYTLEFLELQKAYIKQLNKIESLQSELQVKQSNEIYYKNMISKLKDFILNDD